MPNTDSSASVRPAFDPEVLGGDTCALGECCINPCGFLLGRLVKLFEGKQQQQQQQARPFTTPGEVCYIAGCYGGWTIIFSWVYPALSNSMNVSNLHKKIGYVVFMACISSWGIAKTTPPGKITANTLHVYDNYEYDNVLYYSCICPTKRIRKLARSKYDRYSGDHVPRFDHHCPLLNRTIGEENYRFFLAFLLIHAVMCWYGTIICFLLSWEAAGIFENPGILSEQQQQQQPDTFHRAWNMFRGWSASFSSLAVLLGLAAACLSFFLGFHFYIISVGMTTNEYYKWKTVTESLDAPLPATHKDDEEAAGVQVAKNAIGRHRNLYHLGILQNFREVLHPRCQQRTRPKKQM